MLNQTNQQDNNTEQQRNMNEGNNKHSTGQYQWRGQERREQVQMQMATSSSSSDLNPNRQQQMNSGPLSTNHAACLINGIGPDTLSLLNQTQALQSVIAQLDNSMNATSQLPHLALFSGNPLLLNQLLSQQLLESLGGVVTASNSSAVNTSNYISQGTDFSSSLNTASLVPGKNDMKSKLKTKKRKKPKDCPRRPLSAYNLFFKDERKKILDEIRDADDEGKDCTESKAISSGDASTSRSQSQSDASVSVSRTPHGKVGFESLAKTIGSRWRVIDPDRLKRYKEHAEVEQKRYSREMKEYEEKIRLAKIEDVIKKQASAADAAKNLSGNIPRCFSTGFSSSVTSSLSSSNQTTSPSGSEDGSDSGSDNNMDAKRRKMNPPLERKGVSGDSSEAALASNTASTTDSSRVSDNDEKRPDMDQTISNATSSDNATSSSSDIFPMSSLSREKIQQEQQRTPQQQVNSANQGLPPNNSLAFGAQLEQALRHHQQQQLQGQFEGQIFQQQQALGQQVAAALRDNHPGNLQQQSGNNINNSSSTNQQQQQAQEQQVAAALKQQSQPQGNLQGQLLQRHVDEQNLRALIEATLQQQTVVNNLSAQVAHAASLLNNSPNGPVNIQALLNNNGNFNVGGGNSTNAQNNLGNNMNNSSNNQQQMLLNLYQQQQHGQRGASSDLASLLLSQWNREGQEEDRGKNG